MIALGEDFAFGWPEAEAAVRELSLSGAPLESLDPEAIRFLSSMLDAVVARRYPQCRCIHDDIKQDVWLSLFRRLRRFEAECERGLTLRRIFYLTIGDCYYVAIRSLLGVKSSRASRRHGRLRYLSDAIDGCADPSPSAPVERRIAEHLEDLDEKPRLLLTRYFVDGLTVDELAAKHGVRPVDAMHLLEAALVDLHERATGVRREFRKTKQLREAFVPRRRRYRETFRSPHGRNDTSAKLTEAIVRDVLRSTRTDREEAMRIGCSEQAIRNVRWGISWKHVSREGALTAADRRRLRKASTT